MCEPSLGILLHPTLSTQHPLTQCGVHRFDFRSLLSIPAFLKARHSAVVLATIEYPIWSSSQNSAKVALRLCWSSLRRNSGVRSSFNGTASGRNLASSKPTSAAELPARGIGSHAHNPACGNRTAARGISFSDHRAQARVT
jgi:hypothetical protein